MASAVARAEETYRRRNPLLDRDLRDVCSRLDPEDRNAERRSAAAGNRRCSRSPSPAVRTEPEPLTHPVDVAARVFDPAGEYDEKYAYW